MSATVSSRGVWVSPSSSRLFGDVGDLGFNVEDFELTHDAVREVGYLSISVERPQAERFQEDLESRGWRAWLDREGI